jgi:hypothetical protein
LQEGTVLALFARSGSGLLKEGVDVHESLLFCLSDKKRRLDSRPDSGQETKSPRPAIVLSKVKSSELY